jgi:DNA replication protein DnaD
MKLRCYNIKLDFDNNGARKPDAKAKDIPFTSVHDLNGGVYISPPDLEKIKVWLSDSRDWARNHCQ